MNKPIKNVAYIHLIQKRLACSNSEYHDRNELWDVMNLE